MVIRSVVVESVAADRNVLQIILAAVFHCLLPSVLWVYAPVNWGVGSVFQLQKMHIYIHLGGLKLWLSQDCVDYGWDSRSVKLLL